MTDCFCRPSSIMTMVPTLVVTSIGAGWAPAAGSLSDPTHSDPSRSLVCAVGGEDADPPGDVEGRPDIQEMGRTTAVSRSGSATTFVGGVIIQKTKTSLRCFRYIFILHRAFFGWLPFAAFSLLHIHTCMGSGLTYILDFTLLSLSLFLLSSRSLSLSLSLSLLFARSSF